MANWDKFGDGRITFAGSDPKGFVFLTFVEGFCSKNVSGDLSGRTFHPAGIYSGTKIHLSEAECEFVKTQAGKDASRNNSCGKGANDDL